MHGLLIHKNIRIPLKKIIGDPPFLLHYAILGRTKGGGEFQKLSYCSEILDMTSEGLGEIFKNDFADTCPKKIPLGLMGDWAEGQECADPGERTTIGASGILKPIPKFSPKSSLIAVQSL